jgi:16S rRNA (adenine1518-N6/adenine1519-N6)-dimethyltransferase
MPAPHKEVIIVNENNEVIGSENLMVAIENKQLRRVARIFVTNELGQFLLQKRSQNVYKPGLYDVSVGGHVDIGESYEEAAVRELKEELGLNTPLPPPTIISWLNERAFCNIYFIYTESDTPINFNQHEIEKVVWKSREEIDTIIKTESSVCAPALIDTWALITKSGYLSKTN